MTARTPPDRQRGPLRGGHPLDATWPRWLTPTPSAGSGTVLLVEVMELFRRRTAAAVFLKREGKS